MLRCTRSQGSRTDTRWGRAVRRLLLGASIVSTGVSAGVVAGGGLGIAAAAPPPLPAAAPAPAPDDGARYDALVDEYYAGYAEARPVEATELGIHDQDGALDDPSPSGVDREIARMHDYARRFERLDEKRLSPDRAADLRVLRGAIASRLFWLEKEQPFRHRADFYSTLATKSIYVLIVRAFAPEEARLASVVARERRIPRLLEEAKTSLAGVPRINVDITLDELPGILQFFQRDVPRAFPSALGKKQADAKLVAEFAVTNAQVVQAFEEYARFVKDVLAKKADAPFALGEARFVEKLRADEMIEEPLDALLARGEAELARLKAEFKKTAAAIDPKKTLDAVHLDITRDYPPPGQVLAHVQARLAALRAFLVDKHIVTIPSEAMPRVEETPPFMRATTLASMFTPGPFEKANTDAMYNITLPEKDWAPARVDDYMRGALNRPLMDVVSIHEAFPGHFVQFLWLPRIKSKVRRFEITRSNEEGWAHYCEQMMLDEGFGAGDPKLRLEQLQDALLRAARFVVGIRMHTRGMTTEQAMRFFEHEGLQSQQVAKMETRRGTEDPTYLVYTWGKLEILKLREDYRRKLGARYSLQGFHDALLAQGDVPLPVVRKALLAE